MTQDPIDALMNEHRLIEQVLTALERWASRADAGEPVQADLAPFVEVIRDFTDEQHHGKEEHVLFRALLDAGMPAEAGPVAVMLHEHGIGRDLIVRLSQAARATAWDPVRADATEAARGYAELMRLHIQKEDRILYPMARRLLGAELAQVGERCAELDARAAPRRSELITAAELLVARYR